MPLKKWWYNYGLLGEHFRQTGAIELKPNFLSVCNGVPPLRSALSLGNELSSLGTLLENDLINEMGKIFNNNGSLAGVNLPDDIKNRLQYVWGQGYKVMATQGKVDLSPYYPGKTPEPDILLFKLDAGGNVDFDDVIYIDSKLQASTNLSGSQADLNALSGTGQSFELTNFVNTTTVVPQIFKPSNVIETLNDIRGNLITLKESEIMGLEYRPVDLFNAQPDVILKRNPQ
jgi:hypothetical protein